MRPAPIKVLVVDSELSTRALLRRRLSPKGFEVMEATNSTAAIEFLRRNPALILLDPCLTDVHGGNSCEKYVNGMTAFRLLSFRSKTTEEERSRHSTKAPTVILPNHLEWMSCSLECVLLCVTICRRKACGPPLSRWSFRRSGPPDCHG